MSCHCYPGCDGNKTFSKRSKFLDYFLIFLYFVFQKSLLFYLLDLVDNQCFGPLWYLPFSWTRPSPSSDTDSSFESDNSVESSPVAKPDQVSTRNVTVWKVAPLQMPLGNLLEIVDTTICMSNINNTHFLNRCFAYHFTFKLPCIFIHHVLKIDRKSLSLATTWKRRNDLNMVKSYS